MTGSRMLRAGAAVALLALLAGCAASAPGGTGALNPAGPPAGSLVIAEHGTTSGDATLYAPAAPLARSIGVSLACIGPGEVVVEVAGLPPISRECAAVSIRQSQYEWRLARSRPAGSAAARVRADSRVHWALVLYVEPDPSIPLDADLVAVAPELSSDLITLALITNASGTDGVASSLGLAAGGSLFVRIVCDREAEGLLLPGPDADPAAATTVRCGPRATTLREHLVWPGDWSTPTFQFPDGVWWAASFAYQPPEQITFARSNEMPPFALFESMTGDATIGPKELPARKTVGGEFACAGNGDLTIEFRYSDGSWSTEQRSCTGRSWEAVGWLSGQDPLDHDTAVTIRVRNPNHVLWGFQLWIAGWPND